MTKWAPPFLSHVIIKKKYRLVSRCYDHVAAIFVNYTFRSRSVLYLYVIQRVWDTRNLGHMTIDVKDIGFPL